MQQYVEDVVSTRPLSSEARIVLTSLDAAVIAVFEIANLAIMTQLATMTQLL